MTDDAVEQHHPAPVMVGVDGVAQVLALGVRPDGIVGVPHPELCRRFRIAATGARETDAEENLEVICWREMLLSVISLGSPAETNSALALGTESIDSTLFFPRHTAVDDNPQASQRRIAIHLAAAERGRADLARDRHKALALRDSFWSWLHERSRGRGLEPRSWVDAAKTGRPAR